MDPCCGELEVSPHLPEVLSSDYAAHVLNEADSGIGVKVVEARTMGPCHSFCMNFPCTTSSLKDLSFTLSVCVVSASVPELHSPGMLSRKRPQLEVALGDVQKHTKLAKFIANDTSTHSAKIGFGRPWLFGDVLSFHACVKDVVWQGITVRLMTYNDVMFGPLTLRFPYESDHGEANVDLWRCVLPACRDNHHQGSKEYGNFWESREILVPIKRIRCDLPQQSRGHTKSTRESRRLTSTGSAAEILAVSGAHVALVFRIDTDPAEVLAAAEWEACNNLPSIDDRWCWRAQAI